MFINKSKEKSVTNSPKMTSYINLFLKTEVTCIPKILKNYLGDYYNNALFNGATWVFVLWCILHIIFDKLIDAFLKKLRFREYVRLRLKNSLWYLGFYGTALVYSRAALAQNEVELFNFKKMHVPSSSNLPSQVVIGYTLISTFFLHSSLWEGLAKEFFLNMLSYTLLFLFLVSSYILRVVEISFTLTALISIAQVAVEFTRCCFMSSTQDSFSSKLFVGLLYFTTYAICFAVYIVVIPLTFIIPLGLKIMTDYPNILLLFLFFNLTVWLILEIYQSVLFKLLDHWFYHKEETESDNFLHCSIGLLECSLFKPRDDVSYNLQVIKQEIKARQAKMMSMRKPKNKTMLIQTLKCMMAIKRKITEKRRSESSDSESEKSEDRDLKISENSNTDGENGELLSDQDETDEESQEQDSVIENAAADSENKTDDSKEECDKNEESDDEEVASNESEVETEKEICIEDNDCDEKLMGNKTLDLEYNNNNNSNKGDKSSSETSTIVNEEVDSVESSDINKKNTNNGPTIALHDGDNSTVQIVKDVTESKIKNSSSLLVKGDSDTEEDITESNRNRDNENNSLLSEDSLQLQKEKSNTENTDLSNLDNDELNKETSHVKT